jgi:hypothetical protein
MAVGWKTYRVAPGEAGFQKHGRPWVAPYGASPKSGPRSLGNASLCCGAGFVH